MFRGAVQTAAYHYLAELDGRAVGYIDCGTFDRATVYCGDVPDGPVIAESIEVTTGSIAFAVHPALRRRGVGRVMIAATRGGYEIRGQWLERWGNVFTALVLVIICLLVLTGTI